MNVFDTEHPLNSSQARPGFMNRGWYLYSQNVFVVALILFPILTGIIWYLNVTDFDSTDEDAGPFWMVAMAAAIGSVIFSLLLVSIFWLYSWLLRALRKQRSVPVLRVV
jgi:hypothetical protein